MGKKSKPQKKKSNHKRGGGNTNTSNTSNGTSSSSTSNYYGLRNPPFGTSTASSSTTTTSAAASSSFDNEDEIFTTYSSISQSSSTSFQSLLSIYKTAISKFKETLMDMVPPNGNDDEIFSSSRGGGGDDVDVEALLDAVDYIIQQQQQEQSSSSSNDNSNVVVNNGGGKEVDDGTELLSNLRLAIRIRKKYINNKGKSGGGGGGGEESQEYFFAILNYCLQNLTSYFGKKKLDTTKVDKKEEEESTRKLPTLRFAALSLLENDDNGHDDDGDDDNGRDDEEETKPASPVRPQSNHTQKKSYTYSDLMELPDKAQCQFLFDTIACHVHRLCKYLQNLKESIRMMQNIDDDDDANNSDERMTSDQILNELTGLYIVSTSMILDIQNLEQDIYRECPQLGGSPYRVIACVFLTPFINLIKDTIKEQSQMLAISKKSKYSPEDVAIAYVGDIVECIFRKCRIEETKEISTRFCKRWKLSEHWTSRVCWISDLYSRLIFLNVMTKYEEYSQGDSIAKGLKERMGGQKLESLPNNWLEENPFWECISGNRSIFSTMKLLDMFGGSSYATTHGGGESTTTTNTHKKHPFELVYSPLLMANGIWDEETNLATTLRGGCIETLLMQNLLPCIMNSSWSDNGIPVVRETTMLPLVHMIRSWTNHSNQQFKNSFALTFGVHAMLLSILEIQGDGDVTRIGKIAESTYDDFFMQVQDGLNTSVPISKARKETLDFILKMRQMPDLPKPTQVQQLDSTPSSSSQNNEDRQRMLLWNPLCASMFVDHAKLCLSLEGGLSAMNLCFETTSVLHLYNALKRCGMVDDDLPLVAEIDRKFSQVKRVWNGLENKPEKGKFLYRWHLSMGADHGDSLYHQEVVKARLLGVDPPPQKGTTTSPSKSNNHRRSSNRVASEIKPEDVSRTFKYFCHHEFDGAENEVVPDHVVKVNHHHHHPMPESMQQSSIQLYRTIMAFADESDDLLSYNMVAVSSVFQQFLFEVFQNPPEQQQQNVDVSDDVAKQMDLPFPSNDPGVIRALMNFKETERILGNLDYEHNIDEAQKLGKSFQEFFTNLDLNKVRIKPKPPTL